MDFRATEAAWLSQINTVFNDGNIPCADPDQKSITDLKQCLKNLLHRRVKTWWNKATLEKYVSNKMIPRGLRVQVFPSFGQDDNPFNSKWESICNNCSLAFMSLIIEHNTQTLETISKQVDELEVQVTQKLSPADLELFKNELSSAMKEWEKHTTAIKSKKFQRDTNDFSNNRVYKWKITNPTIRSRSASMSSHTSTNSEASTGYSTERRPFQQYRQKRKF